MAYEFPWDRATFYSKVEAAIASYWNTRSAQAQQQASSGRSDAGSRGEVTGGKHLDGFGNLLCEIAAAAGYSECEIHFAPAMYLPGYYRAQKKWDLTVVRQGRLLAAVELKSQSGSFGNNLNNRTEEVLGLSHDFWVAYRERAFGVSPAPWLGYFFVLEDSAESSSRVGLANSPFRPFSIFDNTSYKERYKILCERLVLERDYTATALLLSDKTTMNISEPSADLSAYTFCMSLFRHLVTNA